MEVVILDDLTGKALDGLGDDLVVTMDPGTVNFGMDMYQPALGIHVLARIDITLERDPETGNMRQFDVRESDLCTLADRITEDYRDVLERANVIGIERQPHIANGKGGRSKINFIAFEHALRAMCMGKFPRAHVLGLNPRARCGFFNTSGENHDHNKRLTWWYVKSILSAQDAARVQSVFGIDDDSGSGVDALDCLLYALYVQCNYDTLIRTSLKKPQFKAAHRRNTNNTVLRQCVLPATLFSERLATARARGLSLRDAARSLGRGPRPEAHVGANPRPRARAKPSAKRKAASTSAGRAKRARLQDGR